MDELDPRFAAAVRGALLREVRGGAVTTRPAVRRRPALALGIALAATAVIVTGGVVLSQQRRAAPAASPFGGDCAAVLDASVAARVVGAPVVLQQPVSPLDVPASLAVPAVGGLSCVWTGDGDTGLVLDVLPSGLLRDPWSPDESCFASSAGAGREWTCRIDEVVGGRWYAGFLTGVPGTTRAAAEGGVAGLRDALRRLPGDSGDHALRRTGWWRSVGCTALGRGADLAAVLGHPGLRADPGDGSMVSSGAARAVDVAVVASCVLEADTDTDRPFIVDLHAVAGAGALAEQVLQGPEVQRLDDVDGARVYRVDRDGAEALWVVADGGVLTLQDTDPQAALPAVAPLLRVLDAARA